MGQIVAVDQRSSYTEIKELDLWFVGMHGIVIKSRRPVKKSGGTYHFIYEHFDVSQGGNVRLFDVGILFCVDLLRPCLHY